MKFDFENLPSSDSITYDVCIIGGGAAGITVANELADSGKRICLLESGLNTKDKRADRLKCCKSDGIEIKGKSRERILGGSSTTWAGLSSPLDPIDFAKRNFLKTEGWPISRSSLIPFYEKASDKYNFPKFKDLEKNSSHFTKIASSFSFEELEQKPFLANAEAQDFGKLFSEVFDSENVDLILGATACKLVCKSDSKTVNYAIARGFDKSDIKIYAKVFILCCSAIEASRLLLLSNIGNEHDLVGRYFMNHPKDYCGLIRLKKPTESDPALFGHMYRGYSGYLGLRLPEPLQQQLQVLNSYVRFEPVFNWSENDGVKSLVHLAKKNRAVFKATRRKSESKLVQLKDYSETGDDVILKKKAIEELSVFELTFNVLRNPLPVFKYLLSRLSISKTTEIREVKVRNFMEMEPLHDNRVTLSDSKDDFGNAVPLIRHSTSERDRASLIALHQQLAASLESSGTGSLDSPLLEPISRWPINDDASHHLGGTRMGSDPRHSVVDENCKVHSISNLYVASGSVFPTSGCANPTYTIVALSIRLAEYLKLSQFTYD